MITVVFKCKSDKYFVGKTGKRNDKHISNKKAYLDVKNYSSACAWTNRYKLESVIEITDKSINDTTLEYMSKYGIQNVRGGSWQQLELSSKQIKEIEKLIEVKNLVNKGMELQKEIFTTKKIVSPNENKTICITKEDPFEFTDDDLLNVNTKDILSCSICNQTFESIEETESHESICASSQMGMYDYLSDAILCSFGAASYIASFINN